LQHEFPGPRAVILQLGFPVWTSADERRRPYRIGYRAGEFDTTLLRICDSLNHGWRKGDIQWRKGDIQDFPYFDKILNVPFSYPAYTWELFLQKCQRCGKQPLSDESNVMHAFNSFKKRD
jgi:hypothetical protein